MDFTYCQLGMRIRHFRLQRKLTQEQLAEKANLSRSYISKIEIGNTRFSLESLISIANALEVSTDNLLADYLNLPTVQNTTIADQILSDCSSTEIAILTENMSALKSILKGYTIRK